MTEWVLLFYLRLGIKGEATELREVPQVERGRESKGSIATLHSTYLDS
jgi:hypothetical protein